MMYVLPERDQANRRLRKQGYQSMGLISPVQCLCVRAFSRPRGSTTAVRGRSSSLEIYAGMLVPLKVFANSRLDIIRGFAGTRRLCFTQDIRDMVASASGDRFELVNGCPREIFLILGRALDKTKEYQHDWTTEDDFHSTLSLASGELYSWNPQDKTYPSSDPRWKDVAVAFQYSCILHIHRLLDPLQPAQSPEIQAAVSKILDATAAIPADCTLIELLITPLFLAGADSLSAHSQYYVLARIREIEGRSEMRNRVPADLLKRVWAARTEGQDVSWRDFVSDTHIIAKLTSRPAFRNLHDSTIT